jgi:AcrR family transcriptional regulator
MAGRPTTADPDADARDGDRPLRARGRATRGRLLDAGVAVFSRKGFHATRVDDIVKRARTSHGTFYLYFPSKDALFEQLVADVADEFRTLTESLPDVTPTPASHDALARWLVSFIEVYAHYGPLIRSWTESDRRDASEGMGGDDVLATVADALAARIKVRRRKDLDPAVAALALVAMVERVNYFLATGQLTEDATAVAGTLATIMMDALFGPGAAS